MNRECAMPGGAGIYPLAGDVKSSAGSSSVTVTGLQTIPVSSTFPVAGASLEYSLANSNWAPALRQSIQVNGVSCSDDYIISINVVKEVLFNGT